MTSVSLDIRLFMKERNVTRLPDIVRLADNLCMARGGRFNRSIDSKPKSKINYSKSDSGNSHKPRDYRNIKCHGCGEIGHIKPKCPKTPLSYVNANLPDHGDPLRYAKVFDFLGRESSFPVVRCYVRFPFYDGWAEVVKAPLKFCSVLIGNVHGTSKVL